MKKIFLVLLFGFLFSGNAHAKYLEIVCTPYVEFGPDYKDKKIIGSEYIKEIIYVPRYQGLSSSDIINGTYKTPYL